ncbi:MAG: hypothetical protein JKY22_00255, partial [Flavobacteriaceae bacterium]|nr:hypothetical protein [Flavobacteriaceae bacterium]
GNTHVTVEELEFQYKHNSYRKNCESRLSSWSINEFGNQNTGKAKHLPDSDKYFFGRLLECRISNVYSDVWRIPNISFGEAVSKLGYSEDFEEEISGMQGSFVKEKFGPTIAERKLMLGKWIKRKAYLSSGVHNLRKFIMPLEM